MPFSAVTDNRISEVPVPGVWRRSLLWLLLLVFPFSPVVFGQTARRKPAKTGKAKAATAKKGAEQPPADEDAADPAALELPGLEFDAVVFNNETRFDLDETPEGKQRVTELLQRARELFRERDGVERERRPLAGPRDVLWGQIQLLTFGIRKAQAIIVQSSQDLQHVNAQLNLADGQERANLQARKNALSGQISAANGAIVNNQRLIDGRLPELTALNLQIAPFDERLRKLWEELNEARKQWLEIRQPQVKYSIGDFESLRKVLDDWLLIDGLWPEAFCWGALCAYEQKAFGDALSYLEKAERARKELRLTKVWPAGDALRGLVSLEIKGQRGKARGLLQKALGSVAKNKNSDWVTYFLVGRAWTDLEESGSRGKANFESALKIQPDAMCVKYSLARLQTTSATPSVRDVQAGTKTLEVLWDRSTKRSWRLAHALVLAYDANKLSPAAEEMMQISLNLAPRTEHETLHKIRAAQLN